MSGLSEAALHVQAMRFVCKALADREQQGIEVDWDVLRHMLNMLETIFQGIEDQRDDDRDELMHTRQDRDAAQAEIETLRKELDAAKRAASDEFAERQVLTVEQQQDAAAWQQQVDSANAESAYLRARLDEERSVSAGLREQLRTAAGRVDLTEENNRSLREQLDAANAAVTLQRAGIERLQAFVNLSRRLLGVNMNYADVDRLRAGLAELDAGTQPAPVAEPTPCPEVERLRAELETANEHRTDLLLFVDRVRKSFRVWGGDQSFFDSVSHALDQLDAGTIKPAPVAETLDAEGGA